jgi:hypothetical protein
VKAGEGERVGMTGASLMGIALRNKNGLDPFIARHLSDDEHPYTSLEVDLESRD